MGRTYKRTTQRGACDVEALNKTLSEVSKGMPIKMAARQYHIPVKTLRRHRDGKVRTPGSIHLGHFVSELHKDYEEELVCLIKNDNDSVLRQTFCQAVYPRKTQTIRLQSLVPQHASRVPCTV
jgi:hypothetical protein